MRRFHAMAMAWVWLALLAALPARAQAPVSIDFADDAARAASVQRLRQFHDAQAALARQTAAQRGWTVRGQTAAGAQFELISLEAGAPRYYIAHNENAAISTAANLIRNIAPYLVNGAGWTVGVWDGGSARTTHQEFGGRVTALDGAAIHNHATHVTGTIAAAGVTASAMGMAPSVSVDSYDWNSDSAEMTSRAASAPQQANRIYLSNHSYGLITGWETGNFSGSNGPHWWGVWGESEDRNFGRYGATSSEWDAIAYAAPYYLIFKASGNDRNDAAPSPGQTFYYLSGNVWRSKTYNPATDPAGDGVANGGYDSISNDGLGKNVITVGAVEDAVAGGSRNLANATMTSFSSWGPADDGRIKPDLSGNGASLYSTVSTSNTEYGNSSGTSMATPNVAGTAALLIDFYGDVFPGQAMRSSSLKGLLIHTADDLGPAGPDYAFGWGLVNARGAADLIQLHKVAPDSFVLQEAQLASGAMHIDAVHWDGVAPLKATLVWTDPASSSISGLDNPTPALVNDLDLRVAGPDGTTRFPFRLDRANPSALATAGDNVVDNVEQVLIQPGGGPPGLYTITVSHKGALPGSGQWYSLWISGHATNGFSLQPFEAFESAGPQGGPFAPTLKTYTLTNDGLEAFNYTVSVDAGWLEASPAGGALGSGQSVNVTLALTAAAEALPAGAHAATATFHNVNNGAEIERPAVLTVRGVNGFQIGPISPVQAADTPFPIDVEAVDETGARVTAFEGSAALSALTSSLQSIGDGAGSWGFPLYTYYEDARLQTIYPAALVGQAGRILALWIEVTQAPPLTMNNWTLRMKHTPMTEYPQSPSWESGGWTTVYQNNETIPVPGWRRFEFSTPFDYNGVDSLMVDFSFNNASYFSEGQSRSTSSPAGIPSIFGRSDSNDGDPLDWAGVSPTPQSDPRYPNLSLELETTLAASPVSIGPFAGGAWSGDATVHVTAAQAALRVEDGAGHRGESGVFAVEPAPPLAIQFDEDVSSVAEDGGTATLAVSINGAPAGDSASVEFIVAGGTAEAGNDYQISSAELLVFEDGPATLSIDLTILDDELDDFDRTVAIQLVNPENAQIGPRDTHTLTILDDDDSPSVGFAQSKMTVQETDGTMYLKLVLVGNESGKPITVQARTYSWEAGGGADFTEVEQTIAIDPPAREAFLALAILDDDLPEGTERFYVELHSPENATLGPAYSHIYIEDDEAPSNAAEDWRRFR